MQCWTVGMQCSSLFNRADISASHWRGISLYSCSWRQFVQPSLFSNPYISENNNEHLSRSSSVQFALHIHKSMLFIEQEADRYGKDHGNFHNIMKGGQKKITEQHISSFLWRSGINFSNCQTGLNLGELIQKLVVKSWLCWSCGKPPALARAGFHSRSLMRGIDPAFMGKVLTKE